MLLSPTIKNPIPIENSKTSGQHKNATKNFDYTKIADRLRSNNNHPTVVVKPGLKGTNLPTHRNSRVIKRTRHDRNNVYITNKFLFESTNIFRVNID